MPCVHNGKKSYITTTTTTNAAITTTLLAWQDNPNLIPGPCLLTEFSGSVNFHLQLKQNFCDLTNFFVPVLFRNKSILKIIEEYRTK